MLINIDRIFICTGTPKPYYQYYIHCVAFVYVLVPPSPTYGVSGLPQALNKTKTNMPSFNKVGVWQTLSFLMIFDDCAYLLKHEIDVEHKSMKKSGRISPSALI